MIGGGRREQRLLPRESFAELAFEARLLARDKAAAAESCEVLIATFEARGEIDNGVTAPRPARPLELPGMRDAVAELQHRALMAGRMAEALAVLAAREEEIRAMFAAYAEPAESAR